MGFWDKLRGKTRVAPMQALYDAIVAKGRAPHWYLEGGVPDTIDGRFDMIAAVLSMVLIRLEAEPGGAEPGALLAECFIEDMDGQMRQIGIGDITVGKHVGKMMGMLGGRLGAYREGLANGEFEEALRRNLYRAGAPEPAQLAHSRSELERFHAALAPTPLSAITRGDLPE